MTSERTLILVPVDFQAASNAALNTALELSAPLRATIVALHVQDSLFAGPAELPTSLVERAPDDERRHLNESRLQDLCSRFAGIEPMLRTGSPEAEIMRAIRELSPALVIMGTHGRSGLSRIMLGSVAEYVVMRSPVPVMTIRATS